MNETTENQQRCSILHLQSVAIKSARICEDKKRPLRTHRDGKSWFLTWLHADNSSFCCAIFGNKQRFTSCVRRQKQSWRKNDGQHCFQATKNLIRRYLVVSLCASACPSCFKPVNKELGFHPQFVFLTIVQAFCQAWLLQGATIFKPRLSSYILKPKSWARLIFCMTNDIGETLLPPPRNQQNWTG